MILIIEIICGKSEEFGKSVELYLLFVVFI